MDQVVAPINPYLSQLVYLKTNIAGYFFDAVIKAEHKSTLKLTSHPVQTGSNITDHSFVEPATVTFDIGMSDVMESYIPGQFGDYSSRSVSAYKVLKDLQKARIPLQINTRLDLYQNMFIETIDAVEDYKTAHGLRVTVYLKEVFVVEVIKTTNSTKKQTTGTTKKGPQQTKPVEDKGSALSQMGL